MRFKCLYDNYLIRIRNFRFGVRNLNLVLDNNTLFGPKILVGSESETLYICQIQELGYTDDT